MVRLRFLAGAFAGLVVGMLLVLPLSHSTTGQVRVLEWVHAPPPGHVAEGRWSWLTVRQSPVSVANTVLSAVLDPPRSTASADFAQMRRSELAASSAALRLLGQSPAPSLLVVDRVHPQATDDLAPGDVITHAGGVPVGSLEQFRDWLAREAPGPVALTVVRGREVTQVSVPLVPSIGPPPTLGWMLSGSTAPPSLEVDTGSVSGASAGLLFTLAYLDAQYPGDLAGSMAVAATGDVGLDGQVWPVGGVAWKVDAAVSAGVDVVFVPVANASEALAAARGRVSVVTVASAVEAVAWLCNRAVSPDPVCSKVSLP